MRVSLAFVVGRALRAARALPSAVQAKPSMTDDKSKPAEVKSKKNLRLPDPSLIRSHMWKWALSRGILKHYIDGKLHVTAINCNTRAKSIVKLSLPPKAIKNSRLKSLRLSLLPSQALEALGGLIMSSNKAPKVLQREADELSNKLESRHFPASPQEVREARHETLEEIFAENPAFIYHWEDGKQRPFLDKALHREVQRRLAQSRYNWKPMQFKNREAALVYALSRFGGYFAEMRRVLAEFDRNEFVPETILDYGSGVGSAFWAAFERWGDKVREYSLMDKDDVVRHFSMDLLRGKNFAGSGEMITRNVFFRKDLFPSPKHCYDLVILHRTLVELASEEERLLLIEKLWQRTRRFLIVVDSPMSDAFKALIQIRNFILTAGVDFDLDKTKELLRKHGKLDQYTIELFADNKVEMYEKYCVAREKLPEELRIPTRLEPGHVFAPCPHDQACPLLSQEKDQSCNFKVRWQEFRADHKTRSIDRDGTLTGKFSYVILEKGERKPNEAISPRILEMTRARGCASCRLCTPFDGIQQLVVTKRAGNLYKRVRGAAPSQLFPVNFELVKTEVDMLNIRGIDKQDEGKESINKIRQIGSANK